MSLHYLLDGYNVVHRIPDLTLKELEQQRDGLVRLIERFRPQGSFRNEITIVFDGRTGMLMPSQFSVVKVIFSQNETADDKIKRIVENASNKKNIIVVTNDRAIQYAVKASGARVESVEKFISRMRNAKKSTNKINKIEKDTQKNISEIAAFKITEELKNKWIK